MARSQTRPAAWYVDERDPSVLRYWDGSRWTDRRRPAPAWAPAPAVDGAASATALQLPAGLPDPYAQAGRRGSVRRRTGRRHRAAATAGLPPNERSDRARRAVRRSRTLALASFTALLAAVSALGVELQVRHHQRVPAIHDAAFLTAAKTDCQTDLEGSRQPPTTKAVSAAVEADRIDSLSTTLAGVAGELRSLPVDPRDQAAVNEWLDAWDAYTETGHRYATALRQGSKDASAVAAQAQGPRARMDSFAIVNHLTGCIVG